MIRFETSHGRFTVELFPKEAPATVENFLRYVDERFFDGTVFHRIVPGFVLQGGGLTADLRSKQTRAPIKNEAKNGLKNARGTLSMARTSEIDSDSAISQPGTCEPEAAKRSIDETGAVRLPAIETAGNPYLMDQAISAVRTWKFEPITSRGQPVLVVARQEFNFVGGE